MYVQFRDDGEMEIVGVFCGPQDPEFYPNQGEVDAEDERWQEYFEKNKNCLEGLPLST